MIVCTKCKIEKNEVDFPFDAKKNSGYSSWCRNCFRIATMIYNKKHRVKKKKIPLHIRKEIKREKDRVRKRKYRKEHTNLWEKGKKYYKPAHWKVRLAIKSGRLKRKACENCGEEKVHAHHDDYNKPLIVTWLCPLHHAQLHAFMNKEKMV